MGPFSHIAQGTSARAISGREENDLIPQHQ